MGSVDRGRASEGMACGRRQVIPLVIVVSAALVVSMVFVLFGVFSPGDAQTSGQNRPLVEILEEDGLSSDPDEWLDLFSDEQRAAVDLAYDAAVEEGSAGTRAEWVAKEVLARHDGTGDLVIVLPDGAEFSVEIPSTNDTGHTTGADGGTDGLPSPSQDAQGEAVPSTDGFPSLAVETVHARPGEVRVAVPVRIEHNPGILGMTLSVSYDESALTLVDSENPYVQLTDISDSDMQKWFIEPTSDGRYAFRNKENGLYLTIDEGIMVDGAEIQCQQVDGMNSRFVLKKERYALCDEGQTWSTAKQMCERMGGHLVTITSAQEQATVAQLLAGDERHKGGYWLGGYREGTVWKWVTGEPFSYTNWAIGIGEAISQIVTTVAQRTS